MNSEGFCFPLNKYDFGYENGRYWKILIKNIYRIILNLTQNFLIDSKNNLRIQIIPARHSFPWKTTF